MRVSTAQSFYHLIRMNRAETEATQRRNLGCVHIAAGDQHVKRLAHALRRHEMLQL